MQNASFNGFYNAVLGGAATMMGLLFFAVLFNADRRGHKLGQRWLSVARSTLNVYVVLLLLPMILMLPEFDDRHRAAIILALTGFSIIRQFVCWQPTWCRDSQLPIRLTPQLIWLFVGPVGGFLVIACSAIRFLVWRIPFHSANLSIIILILFVIAVRNSWNLVLQHAGLTGRDGRAYKTRRAPMEGAAL